MFNSIYELPSQVRASLDDHDQGVFLKTYNECDPKTREEVRNAIIKAWEACKDLPSSFSFCITASVDMIDRQKEVIDLDSIKKHMDSFIDYGGNVQDEHGDYHVATIWKWEPATVEGKPAVNVWGNVFGGDMVYDRVRKDFVNGKNNLSIAGEADMGSYLCDEKGCYVKRSVEQLMEISLCSVPCNPLATLVWYNQGAKLTKSFDGNVNFQVEEYTIHKDAQFCPIQAVKKSLLAAGIECHAKEYGVEADPKYEKRIAKSETLGYVKKNGKLIVQSRRRMLEKARENCIRKGYAHKNGILKSCTPAKVMAALRKNGFLVSSDGVTRFATEPVSKSQSRCESVAMHDFALEISHNPLLGRTIDAEEDDRFMELTDTRMYEEGREEEVADVDIEYYIGDDDGKDIYMYIKAEYEVSADEDYEEVWRVNYTVETEDGDSPRFETMAEAMDWAGKVITERYGNDTADCWKQNGVFRCD